MSESGRKLVRQGAKQGQRPSVAEMQARIGVLEAELAAAHEREAAIAEVLRQRTRDLEGSLEYQTATAEVLGVINSSPVRAGSRSRPPPRWGRAGVGVMPRTDPW